MRPQLLRLAPPVIMLLDQEDPRPDREKKKNLECLSVCLSVSFRLKHWRLIVDRIPIEPTTVIGGVCLSPPQLQMQVTARPSRSKNAPRCVLVRCCRQHSCMLRILVVHGCKRRKTLLPPASIPWSLWPDRVMLYRISWPDQMRLGSLGRTAAVRRQICALVAGLANRKGW